MGTSELLDKITIHEVTYSAGTKRISILCDDPGEVREMLDKFLGASAGREGSGEVSLRIVRKAMSRDEFDALEDWDGGDKK